MHLKKEIKNSQPYKQLIDHKTNRNYYNLQMKMSRTFNGPNNIILCVLQNGKIRLGTSTNLMNSYI